MIKFLQSPWTSSILGMLLYAVTTLLVWHPAPRVAGSHRVAQGPSPSWQFHNPEMDLLIAELQQERQVLAERSARLDEWAVRLQAEHLELQSVTQAVARLRAEFDQDVARITEEEAANIKKLARTYAAMTPEGAAGILKQLEETTLVKILATLKESETAPILEAMASGSEADARRVAALSERLRLSLSAPPESKRAAR